MFRFANIFQGEGIHFGNVSKSPVYPLIYGKSAKSADASESSARFIKQLWIFKYTEHMLENYEQMFLSNTWVFRTCDYGSLDQEKVKGKIVLCENFDGSSYASSASDEVKSKGGIGCIFVDDRTRAVASAYGTFPTTVIDSKEAAEIFSYVNSTKYLQSQKIT